MFSSKSFVVLGFAFMSMVHFELVFVQVMECGSRVKVLFFFFFYYEYPVVPTQFVEKSRSFSTELCLYLCQKSADRINMWIYFWARFFIHQYH